ncbi:ARM repeat-containing protein, partial [Rhizophagus irregularis]
IPEILFKNDTSRIIQTVLKYGTKEQKKIIVDELEGKWLEASKHTHSKFVICKVLMYCSEHRNKIISEFKGNIAKLIQHTEARSVILEAYELLNARQRSALIQEFYGKEFSLFKETQGLSIEELIKENPSNKERLLENLSREIEAIMKKPDLIGYIIPHHIILDYFNYANENKIREKVALIGEHIHEFLHTREGSRIAMMCFSYGTAKDRKIMLKAMKDYIEKICIEEYGHLVLLRAFDVVDDTVAVSKYIIEQMTKLNKLGNIIQNKWGHRVILYLLAHRTKLYFSNETLRLLAQGDDIRTKTRHDPAVRVNELCKAISPALIDYAQNNTSTMFSFTYSTQVLCEILLHADGTLDQKKPILENIAKLANKDPNNEEAKDDHIMLSYINRTLKTLKDESPQINYDEKVELHFAPILFDSIKEYVLFYACHLSASFVILALLEDKETNKDVKEALLKGLKQIRRAAEKDKKSGANLILKELEKEGIKLESNENKKESKQVIEESKGTIRDENNSGKKNNDKSNNVFEKVTKGKDKEIKKEKGINNGNKNNNRGTKRKR